MSSTLPTPPDIAEFAATRHGRGMRLIALDLDGTCLDDAQRLHPRTRAAVADAVGRGVVVVLATGRMYRSALPWAERMEVRAPLICYQGAVVRAMPDHESPRNQDGIPLGRLLVEHSVPAATAHRALRLARQRGWHFQAYQDERLLCEQDRPEAHEYSRIAGVPITLVEDLKPALDAGSAKVICVIDDGEEAQRCQEAMRAELGAAARVTRSLPQFIEITNPRASKRQALARVCDCLHIDIADTIAVGDAPNDVDMLEAASVAVAVRGRGDPPALFAVADATCAAPQDAGVADVIEVLTR